MISVVPGSSRGRTAPVTRALALLTLAWLLGAASGGQHFHDQIAIRDDPDDLRHQGVRPEPDRTSAGLSRSLASSTRP